jgi:hypothetical protein
MESSNTINWSGKNLETLKNEKCKNKSSVFHLDLSRNKLELGNYLEKFKNLKTLILDEN